MNTTALQILDSHITDAQVERYRKRHILLRDCKAKGFPTLRRLGLITEGAPMPEPQTSDERRSIAAMGSVLVNDGLRITEAAKQCGVTVVTLKNYCKRHGFKLNLATNREGLCREVIKLVNEGGWRITKACHKVGTNPNHIGNSLRRIGLIYDARARKINPIK